MYESAPASGARYLDNEGLDALLRARGGDPSGLTDAMAADLDGLAGALAPIEKPLARLDLTVAGPESQLRHRAWADYDTVTILAATGESDRRQLLDMPPGFLPSALLRLTRMRVRRLGGRQAGRIDPTNLGHLTGADSNLRRNALKQAEAEFAWHLHVHWTGGGRRLFVVDGTAGPRVVEPKTGVLEPISNTHLYRLLSTVLPGSAEIAPP